MSVSMSYSRKKSTRCLSKKHGLVRAGQLSYSWLNEICTYCDAQRHNETNFRKKYQRRHHPATSRLANKATANLHRKQNQDRTKFNLAIIVRRAKSSSPLIFIMSQIEWQWNVDSYASDYMMNSQGVFCIYEKYNFFRDIQGAGKNLIAWRKIKFL